MKKYIVDFTPGICDKCGSPVPKENSALLLQEIATERTAGLVMDRHLYPTESCEGSPSRVRRVETEDVWTYSYALITRVCEESDD